MESITLCVMGLCGATLAALCWILKKAPSRAVDLWCAGGLLLAACLGGVALQIKVFSAAAFAGVMVWVAGGLLLHTLALRQMAKRPVKFVQAALVWSILALCVSLAQAWGLNAQGLFIGVAGVIALLLMGLGLQAWVLRHRHRASAVCLTGIYAAAALTWSVMVCKVWLAGEVSLAGRGGVAAGDALALGALTMVMTHLGFLGLQFEALQHRASQQADQTLHLQQALQQSEQMAQWDRRHGLSELAASMAHELSQPLTNLYLISDRLAMELRETDGAMWHQCVQDLQRNAEKAGEHLGAIRAWVHARTQGYAPVPFEPVVSEALGFLHHVALTEGVQIEVCMPQTHAIVRGDRMALMQLLTHVLRQALQASEGQATRHLRVRVGHAQSSVQLSLADNGLGITGQAFGSGAPAILGVESEEHGLAWVLSQAITQQHGGCLTCHRPPQADGTRVTLTLPTLS